MSLKLCWLYIVSVFLIQSCSSDETRSMNEYSDLEVIKLKSKVTLGDTSAYEELKVVYLEEPLEEFLPWCQLMANKYKYAPAFYDVYYTLLISKNHDLYDVDSLDSQTRELALNNLIIAAKMHQENAVHILDSLNVDWK